MRGLRAEIEKECGEEETALKSKATKTIKNPIFLALMADIADL